MNNFELLSKRMRKKERLGDSDVYQYTELPSKFRIQLIHLWNDTLGVYTAYDPSRNTYVENPAWREVYKITVREFGVFNLGGSEETSICDDLVTYFLSATFDEALDLIDIAFHVIVRLNEWSSTRKKLFEIHTGTNEAINELNRRFHEHEIGYIYEGGALVKIDSQYIHSDAVKPAILLLQETGFQGAEEEFFKAHKHYRNGENKEAIVNALKAFESTIKAICEVRHWPYDSTSPASKLISVILDKDKQFLPNMLESSLTGLATIRNKTSGHGQGIEVVDVPDYLASYALHIAASNIVLLVQAHKALIVDGLDDSLF